MDPTFKVSTSRVSLRRVRPVSQVVLYPPILRRKVKTKGEIVDIPVDTVTDLTGEKLTPR